MLQFDQREIEFFDLYIYMYEEKKVWNKTMLIKVEMWFLQFF